MTARVKIYDEIKYTASSKKVAEVTYRDVKGFEVVTGERATAIGNETDESGRDEYNEYLVITFEDGDTATFRNSHCDLFLY